MLNELPEKMNMGKNPCAKDCANRSIDCHGKCEAYKEFFLSNEAKRERRKRNIVEEYEIDYAKKHRRK